MCSVFIKSVLTFSITTKANTPATKFFLCEPFFLVVLVLCVYFSCFEIKMKICPIKWRKTSLKINCNAVGLYCRVNMISFIIFVVINFIVFRFILFAISVLLFIRVNKIVVYLVLKNINELNTWRGSESHECIGVPTSCKIQLHVCSAVSLPLPLWLVVWHSNKEFLFANMVVARNSNGHYRVDPATWEIYSFFQQPAVNFYPRARVPVSFCESVGSLAIVLCRQLRQSLSACTTAERGFIKRCIR